MNKIAHHVRASVLMFQSLLVAILSANPDNPIVDSGGVKPTRDVTLLIENDALLPTGATDQHYTNGLRLETTVGVHKNSFEHLPFHLKPIVQPLSPLFQRYEEIYLTAHLGQNLYTPARLVDQ